METEPGPAVVLVEPQLGENVGMAARAMANFGLSDLRLVNPRDGWPNQKAAAAAAGADHVIGAVRVFETVAEATGGLTLTLATTARPRELDKPVSGADEAATRVAGHIASGGQAGFLFGRERWGLTNEELALADGLVTLPVVPGFGSLNIAQAVVIIAYEWRRAAGGDLPFAERGEPAASKGELAGLVAHLEGALEDTGFFGPDEKRPATALTLKSMLAGAGFNAQQVRMLRGVIAALERKRTD